MSFRVTLSIIAIMTLFSASRVYFLSSTSGETAFQSVLRIRNTPLQTRIDMVKAVSITRSAGTGGLKLKFSEPS
jgi:hypothetical protein